MADISPLIKLVGKVVKASGDAIVATMLENQTLTIQAAYAAKKTVTQWKEMVEECGSYLNEIGEPLEEYAEVIDLMMREEEGCAALPKKLLHRLPLTMATVLTVANSLQRV